MTTAFPLNPRTIRRVAILCAALISPATTSAATIEAGDVTSALGPSFFIDEAANGGTDTDINQPGAASFDRSFSGLLTRNQGPTRVTLTGIGFATHTSATANDATSVTATLTYLGADEAINGGDDVVIGSATGSFAFKDPLLNPSAEYAFAFDTPLVSDLNITGTRFRIRIAPFNAAGNGSLKLKAVAPAYDAAFGAKLSVAGLASPVISPQRVNLAKFQPVTTGSVTGQRLASYVTDGVTGNDNRWQGESWAYNYARIDFPFPVEIGSAQVFMGVDDSFPISNFNIQYLNGSTWTTIPGASVSGNTNVERNLVFTNPVTATAFRLSGQDANLRIRELALYPPNGPSGFPLGTDLMLNLAYQHPAVASASTAGNFALNAVDGRSTGFMWQTDTAGVNTLDVDLRVSTKIGSVHLYSGAPGGTALAAFSLKYWDGSAWQSIPGGSITGNTTADLVIPFTTPVTTSQVRLEFTNTGTTSIRELCIFPANTGNTGYPLGTNLISSGRIGDYETYNDAFYLINHPASGRRMSISTNGQPALDTSGLTLGRSQYQILLNLSNGTYRLRNRATGNCLSGNQLDKTPSLHLTDLPYAALPHQDWILDPLGGGDFRIINAWSGLVIDTEGSATAQGTALVQNTSGTASTQRWRISISAAYPKKGIGGTSFAMANTPSWAYNWGRTNSQQLPEDTVYDPMQWGNSNWDIGSNQGPIRQEYPAWRRRGDAIHLLGFNEPDRADQSNIPVENAIASWPRLMEMDLPLVSPAPGTADGVWFNTFNTQAAALGHRVDYTAVHTYPGPSSGSSDGLVSFVQSAFTNWQRPVWLTEFSFVDWGGNQSWSEEDNYNCLAEFLWRAESVPELRKYALFVFTEDASNPQPANPWQNFTPAPRSNARDINGNLTAFGKLYAAWDNDATVRTNKNYYIHNKDTRKRIANLTTQSNLAGRNIRTDGDLVQWTLVSTGAANRYYVVSSLDARRLKTDGTTVSLAAAGTTGTTVEWALTHKQHGWYYLGHPSTAKRLKLVYNNSNFVATYSMVADTTTDDTVQWRFIVPPAPPVWSGIAGNTWSTANSWVPGTVPASGNKVTFNETSAANLTTTLDQNFSLTGITVQNPAGPVSIGGSSTLTLGTGGIDLSAATQDLTLTAPVVISGAQTWPVAAGRVLEIGGVISGSGASLTKTGSGTLRLSATNTYSGSTTVSSGTLALAATNVLPNASAVSIGTATLDAGTFSDSTGTLDMTGAATLELGAGAAIAFANSSAVDWSGNTLQITGAFVSGASLRFGTNASGLTTTQLGLITINGSTGPFSLDASGYLVQPYDVWKAQITNGLNQRGDDPDGDGFTNLQEYLFGTSPVAGTGTLTSAAKQNGDLVLKWLQRDKGATYSLWQSTNLQAGSWTAVASPAPAPDADQSGVPSGHVRHKVSLPVTAGQRFYQIRATEN